MPIDKNILEQYIDACALIRETERDIQELNRKKSVVQDSVKGSNPEFPYQPQSFHIEGSREEVADRISLEYEERLLKERKKEAERIKTEVEAWLNTIPMRMRRIIKFKFFEELTWQQVAQCMGRKASGDSVRKEFDNFMRKK